MVHEFVNKINSYRDKVARLRKLSPDYPEVYEETVVEDGRKIYAISTLVIFIHNRKRYRRHCFQFGMPISDGIENYCKDRLTNEVFATIRKGVPAYIDNVLLDELLPNE
jgi:hypothetical protein